MNKEYSFLQEQFNLTLLNENFFTDFFKFNRLCKRAANYREYKFNLWIEKIRELTRKFKNHEITRSEYDAKINFIHNLMAQLELKLDKLNLIPTHG